MLVLRILLLVMIVLALAAPAPAFQCPAPNQLVQQNGKWTAPGGWTQRDYPPPTPQATISGFVTATYDRAKEAEVAHLMCMYKVANQANTFYTMIWHPAPMVDVWEYPVCKRRMPNFNCGDYSVDYVLQCLEGKSAAECAVSDD